MNQIQTELATLSYLIGMIDGRWEAGLSNDRHR